MVKWELVNIKDEEKVVLLDTAEIRDIYVSEEGRKYFTVPKTPGIGGNTLESFDNIAYNAIRMLKAGIGDEIHMDLTDTSDVYSLRYYLNRGFGEKRRRQSLEQYKDITSLFYIAVLRDKINGKIVCLNNDGIFRMLDFSDKKSINIMQSPIKKKAEIIADKAQDAIVKEVVHHKFNRLKLNKPKTDPTYGITDYFVQEAQGFSPAKVKKLVAYDIIQLANIILKEDKLCLH